MPRNDHHGPYNEANNRHHNFQARNRNRPRQQELEPWHRTLHQVPYESSVANYVELDPFTQPQPFPFPVPQIPSHRGHSQQPRHHRPNPSHNDHLNAPARMPNGRGNARHNENFEVQQIRGPHIYHPSRNSARHDPRHSIQRPLQHVPRFADHSMESPAQACPQYNPYHPIEFSHESGFRSPFQAIPTNFMFTYERPTNLPTPRQNSFSTHNQHDHTIESEAPTGYEYCSFRNINEEGEIQHLNHIPQLSATQPPLHASQPNRSEHNQAAEHIHHSKDVPIDHGNQFFHSLSEAGLEDYLTNHSTHTPFSSLPPYVPRPGEYEAAPENLPSTKSDDLDYPGIRLSSFLDDEEEGREENDYHTYHAPQPPINHVSEHKARLDEGDVFEKHQPGLRDTSANLPFEASGVVYHEEERGEGGNPPISNYSAQETNNSVPPYIRQNISHDKQNHRKSHEINKTNPTTYPDADPLSTYQPHFPPSFKSSSPTSYQSSQSLPQSQPHSHNDILEVQIPTHLRQALENLQHALDMLVAVYIQTLGEGEGREGQGIKFFRRMNSYDGNIDGDAERDFMRPVRGRVGRDLYIPGEEVDEEEEEEDVNEEAEEEEEREGDEDEEEEGEYLRMSKRGMRRGWGEGMGREE